MKRILSLLLAAVLCAALVVPVGAGAANYNNGAKTVLCTSPAGYKFNVEQYYKYMMRYANISRTTYCGDYFGKYDNEHICNASSYQFSCTVDSNGVMKIVAVMDNKGFDFAGGHIWFGITINKDYTFSITEYRQPAHQDTPTVSYHNYNSVNDKLSGWVQGYYSGSGYCYEGKLDISQLYSSYPSDIVSQWFGECLSLSMMDCFWHKSTGTFVNNYSENPLMGSYYYDDTDFYRFSETVISKQTYDRYSAWIWW